MVQSGLAKRYFICFEMKNVFGAVFFSGCAFDESFNRFFILFCYVLSNGIIDETLILINISMSIFC